MTDNVSVPELDTDDHVRQRKLVEIVGNQCFGHDFLIPLGDPGSFYERILSPGWWSEMKVSDLAWQALIRAIRVCYPRHRHFIDHAWLAGHRDEPHEPFALITEPYIDQEFADTFKLDFDETFASEWALRCEVFDPALSAWNPGSCRPVVFALRRMQPMDFYKTALQWLLDQDSPLLH